MLYTIGYKVLNTYMESVVYFGGGVWGNQTPLKFWSYRWSPRSHEQEKPVSWFRFV